MDEQTSLKYIPLAQLRSDGRERAVSERADRILGASIATLGVDPSERVRLLSALAVRPEGRGYVVHDGRRRLAQLKGLMRSRAAPHRAFHAKVQVPCVVHFDPDEAAWIAFTANYARKPLRRIEAYDGLRELHAAGRDWNRIGHDLGLEAGEVQAYRTLDACASEILEAARTGVLDDDQLLAYAGADPQDQAAHFARYGAKAKAADIRRALREGVLDCAHPWMQLVGEEVYEARGGRYVTDLFTLAGEAEGLGTSRLVADPQLLQALARERLDREAETHTAEGFARTRVDPRPTADAPAETARPVAELDEEERAEHEAQVMVDPDGAVRHWAVPVNKNANGSGGPPVWPRELRVRLHADRERRLAQWMGPGGGARDEAVVETLAAELERLAGGETHAFAPRAQPGPDPTGTQGVTRLRAAAARALRPASDEAFVRIAGGVGFDWQARRLEPGDLKGLRATALRAVVQAATESPEAGARLARIDESTQAGIVSAWAEGDPALAVIHGFDEALSQVCAHKLAACCPPGWSAAR